MTALRLGDILRRRGAGTATAAKAEGKAEKAAPKASKATTAKAGKKP